MRRLRPLLLLLGVLATACATGHSPADGSTARATDGGPGADAGHGLDAGPGRDASTGRDAGRDAGSTPDAGSIDAAGGCGALTACGGECVDLASDPRHCGGCSLACSVAHAAPSCSGGACGLGACDPGWLDCDGDASNGCEETDDGGQRQLHLRGHRGVRLAVGGVTRD